MKKLDSPVQVSSHFGPVTATHELFDIVLHDGHNRQLTVNRQLAVEIDGEIRAIPGTQETVNFAGENFPADGWTLDTLATLHRETRDKQTAEARRQVAERQTALQREIAALEDQIATARNRAG